MRVAFKKRFNLLMKVLDEPKLNRENIKIILSSLQRIGSKLTNIDDKTCNKV